MDFYKQSVLFILIVVVIAIGMAMAEEQGKSKTLVLEATKVEGKIKKPQVALISIEKRPTFKPMALSSLNAKKDITQSIDQNIFENRMFTEAFSIPEIKETP